MHCGKRHEREVAKLLQDLYDRNFIVKHFYTDDYAGFKEVIPKKYLTQCSDKRNTYSIEQSNSDVRHWLARFRRRGKVVSKSGEMVQLSLKLLAIFRSNNDFNKLINLCQISI